MAKVLFTWMGDPWGRLFRGVVARKPDTTYVVIESKNLKWREFQEEGFERLKARLGEAYKESLIPIIYTDDPGEKEFYGRVIARTCHDIRSLRKMNQDLEVHWDISGAPASFVLLIGTLASVLSTENCKIYVQYVGRKAINDPITHAPLSSKYHKKHAKENEKIRSKLLLQWREEEAHDEGGEIHAITFPRFEFDLFEETYEGLAKRILFLNIPDSSRTMLKVTEVKDIIAAKPDEKKAILRAAYERRPKRSKRNEVDDSKKMDEESVKHSVDVWYSTTVQRFGDMGLVEWKRVGLHLLCKKTYAGDLFTPAIEDLYKEQLSP